MQSEDPELAAMSAIYAALVPLEDEAQGRVLDWVIKKLGRRPVAQRPDINLAMSEEAVRPVVREGTIGTVCARLNAKTCRDLFKAAAFHLSLYQGKDRFSRAEWIACAKDASKHWKAEYSNQMATTISRLHNSGFVNETAKDVFSVPDDELRALEVQIGT